MAQSVSFPGARTCGVGGKADLPVERPDFSRCANSLVIDALRWSDDVRLSDLEPKFTCQACGHRGADVRPNFSARLKKRPILRKEG